MRFPNMIGLLNERRDGNFGLLKLSKAFKFAIQQAMSKAFDMPIPFETAAGAWHTNINSSLTMKPRESSASWFSQAVLALVDEMRCWSWLFMRNR
jgi:hypothetical protein